MKGTLKKKTALIKKTEAKFKIRITKTTQKLRCEIGRVTIYLNGNKNKMLITEISKTVSENKTTEQLTKYLDLQKQNYPYMQQDIKISEVASKEE